MSQIARKPFKPNFKNPRIRDEKSLIILRECDCIICGTYPSDAAHIRYGDITRGKFHTGMQERPSDKWALPLCRKCHTKQHSMNERKFWQQHNINPLDVCEAIFAVNKRVETIKGIINKTRMVGQ